jgi:purine-nucleoside phosphorylase
MTSANPHSTRPATAAALIRRRIGKPPTLAFILGSGFQRALEGFEPEVTIPYREIPGFPSAGVSGHAGRLLAGKWHGERLLVLSGRAHYYEGHSMEEVTFPVRALAQLGVLDLVLTNAAGAINRKYRAGDFMLFTDHLNWMGANPLRGPMMEGWPRFVDLNAAYDPRLRRLLKKAASKGKVRVREGVYAAVSGPSYETPAEIRAYARLGADAVGMSTVPEAIVARQCGLAVAAVSCITNLAAGLQRSGMSHTDVLNAAEKSRSQAARLLGGFVALHGKG